MLAIDVLAVLLQLVEGRKEEEDGKGVEKRKEEKVIVGCGWCWSMVGRCCRRVAAVLGEREIGEKGD